MVFFYSYKKGTGGFGKQEQRPNKDYYGLVDVIQHVFPPLQPELVNCIIQYHGDENKRPNKQCKAGKLTIGIALLLTTLTRLNRE